MPALACTVAHITSTLSTRLDLEPPLAQRLAAPRAMQGMVSPAPSGGLGNLGISSYALEVSMTPAAGE